MSSPQTRTEKDKALFANIQERNLAIANSSGAANPSSQDVHSWTMIDVQNWVQTLGWEPQMIQRSAQALQEHFVDGNVLSELSFELLERIVGNIGLAIKLRDGS